MNETISDNYSIGIDFGTGSARAVIVALSSGIIVGSAEHPIETHFDSNNPLVARQKPSDYLLCLQYVIKNALKNAKENVPLFVASQIRGIGIDATGSTPIPVTKTNQALGSTKEFEHNLNAQAWLWKDQSSIKEAELITSASIKTEPNYMDTCGGKYSAEWFWAKIWHCLNVDKAVFNAAETWVECCDWITSQLCGVHDANDIVRSACAAGHKALWNKKWDGLPSFDFWYKLDPELGKLLPRLYIDTYPIGTIAGYLSTEWSQKTGLPKHTPISVSNLDAHAGAVGAGANNKTMVKIIGTSTCDCLVAKRQNNDPIDGISGFAEDSIIPGFTGLEAGQAAVGDLFNWYVTSSQSSHELLSEEMSTLKAGEHGLLALDWFNGNRCTLANSRLTGSILGLTLHTKPSHVYRALVEATAFGSRIILEQFNAFEINPRVIKCTGGIAIKNQVLMQIYANIMNRTIEVIDSENGCALGAAIAGAVAGGNFESIVDAQKKMQAKTLQKFIPQKTEVKVYERLYSLYKQAHNAFGKGELIDMHKLLTELRTLSVY